MSHLSCRNHRGLRHYWGLRVRGQHTKTTGRRGKTVGVSKKRWAAFYQCFEQSIHMFRKSLDFAIAEHLHQTILDLFSFLWMGFKHLNCLSFIYYFLYGNIFIQMFCNKYFISLFYLIEFWALLFCVYSWGIKV